MQGLEFLSAKSLIENVNLEQAEDLKNILEAKIGNIKTINIKKFLINEFINHESLIKYIKLIERIKSIEYVDDDANYLSFVIQDDPEYEIKIRNIAGDEFLEVNYRAEIPKSPFPHLPGAVIEKYYWKGVDFRKEPALYEYLKGFGETLMSNFTINEIYPEWGDTIEAYLTFDSKHFKVNYPDRMWLSKN